MVKSDDDTKLPGILKIKTKCSKRTFQDRTSMRKIRKLCVMKCELIHMAENNPNFTYMIKDSESLPPFGSFK